jgi:hypothetical protein
MITPSSTQATTLSFYFLNKCEQPFAALTFEKRSRLENKKGAEPRVV